MIFDKLTWVGLMITALGWTLLLSSPQLIEIFTSLSGRPWDRDFRRVANRIRSVEQVSRIRI